MSRPRYAFGDTDLAAQRLGVLAEVFGPTTRPFLLRDGVRGAELAIDLGCGPGHVARQIHCALGCRATVGLDSSERFVELAARDATDGVSFTLHDVTAVPFPPGPADLLFCRFLLTHLSDPGAAVDRWVGQLRPAGRLLIEEAEWIKTEEPAFSRYLEIVQAMLTAQNNELYIGPWLDGRAPPDGAVLRDSQVARLPVSQKQAARMFSMNIRTWKSNDFIRDRFSGEEVQALEAELQRLAEEGTSETTIQWGLRQIAYERP